MDRCLDERDIGCPFCGERITVLIDTSAGSQDYIEDCQVCCRPIRLMIDADGGELDGVRVDCAS
ncbi:MAG: CPXCG motif-containing cysteine-rich protein [Woeseiaceae bacterium]|nr:CPXCG motif-containing cysteine-rich protein [Woeseiaceae bacterium]